MAQTGYTPISIYYSSTAGNTPTAGNLVAGELAINTADGKLFYKDSAGVVQVIAGKGGAGVAGGSNTQVQYNSSGSLAGSANMTFDGTTLTVAGLKDTALTAGRVNYNGTGGILVDSANMTFDGTKLTLANDASISGLTVGKGGGAFALSTAVGRLALNGNTTGNVNTAIGASSLLNNTTGNYNTAIGHNAGYGAIAGLTGSGNICIGESVGYSLSSGSNNTFIGGQDAGSYAAAGNFNTTGAFNTFVGGASGASNTTGNFNTANGFQSLQANTTASNNTAVGYQAGYSGNTDANVFFGYQAGYAATTGGNTILGAYAGITPTGGNNTLVGFGAGNALTTGSRNTFVGSGVLGTVYGAGSAMTTGSKNTILGGYSGNQGGLDIRTANNYIVLSDGDGNPRAYWNSAGALNMTSGTGGTPLATLYNNSNSASGDVGASIGLGANANNTSSYFLVCSTPFVANRLFIYGNGNVVNTNNSYGALSDIAIKENVVDTSPKLEDLCKVKVRNFNLIDDENKIKQIGVVAQELEEVFPSMVEIDGMSGHKQVKYSVFVPMLIKAVQELKAEVDSLKQQLGK